MLDTTKDNSVFIEKKNRVKLLSIALFFTLPTSSWSWPSGFYLGGGMGADSANFQQKGYVKIPPDFKIVKKTKLSGSGPFGTVFAGYGFDPGEMFYLAGEVNVKASDAKFRGTNKKSIHKKVSKTTYKANRSWGVSLLYGVIFPETALLYGKVGYVQGSLHVNTSDDSLANENTLRNKVRYGFGVEKRIFINLSARFDYTRISNNRHNKSTVDPYNHVTKKTVVKPNTNQYEFAFLYRFC